VAKDVRALTKRTIPADEFIRHDDGGTHAATPVIGGAIGAAVLAIATKVQPGQSVGTRIHEVTEKDATGKDHKVTRVEPVKVDKVVGEYQTKAEADATAKKYSKEHGGANVAIVETTDAHPKTPPRRFAPPAGYPLDGTALKPVPFELEETTTYSVVVLDPELGPEAAEEIYDNPSDEAAPPGAHEQRVIAVGNDKDLRNVPDRDIEITPPTPPYGLPIGPPPSFPPPPPGNPPPPGFPPSPGSPTPPPAFPPPPGGFPTPPSGGPTPPPWSALPSPPPSAPPPPAWKWPLPSGPWDPPSGWTRILPPEWANGGGIHAL
jgi:hypothetical protein